MTENRKNNRTDFHGRDLRMATTPIKPLKVALQPVVHWYWRRIWHSSFKILRASNRTHRNSFFGWG